MSNVTADDIASELRGYLREAATDQSTVERAVECAARALDIPFSRAWNIWYGRARRITAHEMDSIRVRMTAIRERKAAQRAHAETLAQAAARKEIEDLKRSIAALESRLGVQS